MSQPTSSEVIQHLSVEVESGVRYCYDNSYVVDPRLIERDPYVLAKLMRPVFVSEMTPAVRAYNQMALADAKIAAKQDFDDGVIKSDEWHIPDNYKNMTVIEMTVELLDRQEAKGIIEEGIGPRFVRIRRELTAYKEIDKLDMLRLMFYIVDTMTANNQIWGVGRGSSVSSYVLFLIGVHDIDSHKYDLDFADFVKPQEIP